MNIRRAFRNFCDWFRPAQFWFCSVGPVDNADIYLKTGNTYQLNLDAPALQQPSAEHKSFCHAVASRKELAIVRQRGFTVQLIRGPSATPDEASNSLDDFWEFSGNLKDD